MNEFHVILPSDSNLDTHPYNSSNKYTVDFEDTITLNENYKCALIDLILPSIEEKLPTKFTIKLVYCKNKYKKEEFSGWDFNEHCIHEFVYETQTNDFYEFLAGIKLLVNGSDNVPMNEVRTFQKKLVLNYFKTKNFLTKGDDEYLVRDALFLIYDHMDQNMSKNAVISFGWIYPKQDDNPDEEYVLLLKFDKYLEEIFKIPQNRRIPDKLYELDSDGSLKFEDLILKFHASIDLKIYEAPFTEKYKLSGWKNQELKKQFKFYILCDIIKTSYVNQIQRRVLRNIRCDNKGQLITKLDKLVYHFVPLKNIKQISIEIVDENFKPVTFSKDKTNVILQFRKNNE